MQIGVWLLYVFLIVVTLILCAGLSSEICSEKVIRSADYATIFEIGITAYNAGDLVTAKDSFLCVTRSPDFRYKAYGLLGRMYKDNFMSPSAARLLLVKSLQSDVITKEEELSSVRDIVDLYEKCGRMPLHYQFYSELLVVLQGASSIDRDLLPPLHNRQKLPLNQFFSCHEIESFANGSLSLLSSYLDIEDFYLDKYSRHTVSNYELFLDILSGSLNVCLGSRSSVANLRSKMLISSTVTKTIPWPANKPVLILFDDVYGDAVFAETVRGLSDALHALGIANKIVTFVQPESENLYIILFASSQGMKAKHFVFWSLEKNPTMVQPGQSVGLKSFFNGFIETAVYPLRIAYDAKSVWDYAEGHFRIWDSTFAYSPWEGLIKVKPPPAGLYKIRPLVAYDLVLRSFFETTLSDGLKDELLPIDVIFFGSVNPHRQAVYDRLTKMSINGTVLRVEFHRKAYGAQRDSLIDSAKIVLNLANHPYPYDTGDFKRSSVNLHRVMYLLAKGKVVLSERTGIYDEEEAVFGDSVIFSNTAEIADVVIRLLQDNELRRNIERKAVLFSAKELNLLQLDEVAVYSQEAGINGHDSIDMPEYPPKSSFSNLYAAMSAVKDVMQPFFETSKVFPYYKSDKCLEDVPRSVHFYSLIWVECVGVTLTGMNYTQRMSEFSLNRKIANGRRVRREDTDVIDVKDFLTQRLDLRRTVEMISLRIGSSSVLDIGCSIAYSTVLNMTCFKDLQCNRVPETQQSFDIIVLSFRNDGFDKLLNYSLNSLTHSGVLLIHINEDIDNGLRGAWYFKSEVIPQISAVAKFFGNFTISIVNCGRSYLVVRSVRLEEIPTLNSFISLKDKFTIDQYVPFLSIYEMHDWLGAIRT